MISTYCISVSAHADKTLHWKILGNIDDTDTFPHIFSLKTSSSGMNLCANSCANSSTNSWTNFSRISCTNLSTKLVRIRMNFLQKKLVMLRMACTVFSDYGGVRPLFCLRIAVWYMLSFAWCKCAPSYCLSYFFI